MSHGTSQKDGHGKKNKEQPIRLAIQICGRFKADDFAKWIKRHADKAELIGWVRENSRGELDVELQGLEKAVKKVLVMIAEGPRGAIINRISSGKTQTVSWETSFLYRR